MIKRAPLGFGLFFSLCLSIYSLESLDDILIGGIYQIELYGETVLEGIVEEKTDSSMVLESQGTPYSFNAALIKEYTLIEPPMKKVFDDGPTDLSFVELLHNSGAVRRVQIRLSNGSAFKGLVTAIDSETVKIDVGGSIIPISRDVIIKISTLVSETPNAAKPQDTKEEKEMTGPFDTIFVRNTRADANGNPLEPILIIGKIESDDIGGIAIGTPQGGKRKIIRDNIVRVQRHTVFGYEQKIQTYAKPLFCPANMLLIDVPPGKEGRPFFKTCIDKYEYPNLKGAVPTTNMSYTEAMAFCEKQGKRLCTVEEWQWSCSGLEGYTYPYGYRLEKTFCNRDGSNSVEQSGNRSKCVGKFGVYDMVGNIFEWVTDEQGNPMLMGGPYSKCQTISPGLSGAVKPGVGLRCCKSN